MAESCLKQKPQFCYIAAPIHLQKSLQFRVPSCLLSISSRIFTKSKQSNKLFPASPKNLIMSSDEIKPSLSISRSRKAFRTETQVFWNLSLKKLVNLISLSLTQDSCSFYSLAYWSCLTFERLDEVSLAESIIDVTLLRLPPLFFIWMKSSRFFSSYFCRTPSALCSISINFGKKNFLNNMKLISLVSVRQKDNGSGNLFTMVYLSQEHFLSQQVRFYIFLAVANFFHYAMIQNIAETNCGLPLKLNAAKALSGSLYIFLIQSRITIYSFSKK